MATKDGLVGLGEAPTDKVAGLIAGRFADRLKGINAAETASARLACLGAHRDFGYLADPLSEMAFAAVEVALWDILGQRLGLPLFRLLGGPVRERAPFVAYAYTVDLADGYGEADVPKVMADIARRSVAETKAAIFEFKIGRHSVGCDVATVHAIRDAVGPSVGLAVDANLAMSVDAARRFLAGAGSALCTVEEPVATLAEMERLREDFGVPVSTHCTDVEKLKAYPRIDCIVGDLNVDGGIGPVMKLAYAMRGMGKRFWLRSNGETGIAWAALCHLGMASIEMERPAQSLMNWCEDDLVEGETWAVRDGGVRPPERPGLGVSLDRAALKHYAALHAKRGAFSRYDAP